MQLIIVEAPQLHYSPRMPALASLAHDLVDLHVNHLQALD